MLQGVFGLLRERDGYAQADGADFSHTVCNRLWAGWSRERASMCYVSAAALLSQTLYLTVGP
jgi:hypothetical protein